MVWGTSSGAGKSWLTTALCRHLANQGLRVAPFKAQNMSNNARVVAGPDGGFGEIGAAQYFQALAARATPEVAMNPLLLKPEADTRSQVVLMGRPDAELSAMPWRARSAAVWPRVQAALHDLAGRYDVLVMEGAGSPAEINLQAGDFVNLKAAEAVNARSLLVTDIDRGGAFAHLYGTWALLPQAHRARVAGFVLNKFRGDAALLAPGPEQLRQMTGVPVVGVIPMQWDHGLPEEDGVFDDASRGAVGADVRVTVAVVAYPRVSNLDEFQPLKHIAGVRLVWARSPAELAGADWVVLPGSKATLADLRWLRERGLDAAVCAHAARGGRVLGICGGLQMLGEAVLDPDGVECGPGASLADRSAPGLGLLPLVTQFGARKTVRRTRLRFGALQGAWAPLRDVAVQGYEIHAGQTAWHPAMAAQATPREVMPGLAWQSADGAVLGCYLHGLFEDAAVLHALFGQAARSLDAVFDGLAANLAALVDLEAVLAPIAENARG
ncbi:cobyric acid synthase CobQ [Comamonas serinivorans]|uniref:Cobyric acid synthase n=1 Tax=Comamonas serinivorans TaxID=1082851 RepID=A0A1Y0EU26_9BURK|nr:cobyric acid synthase [Comamonas serinivorans]ARU06899.1 cobyric acid synthase CobQ [Comamonas serinivorans]